MAIQKTEKIWHNGKFIAWDDATLHVMSHVVHYGSSVFEGIRCYALPTGPAIFRATEHMQRLIDSARIYRIDVPFTRDEILRNASASSRVIDRIDANKDGNISQSELDGFIQRRYYQDLDRRIAPKAIIRGQF